MGNRLGDELVDRRRDIAGWSRRGYVSGQYRGGGHQHRGRVAGISRCLLNNGPDALHRLQTWCLQPVDR
jgi:hypothetical protein